MPTIMPDKTFPGEEEGLDPLGGVTIPIDPELPQPTQIDEAPEFPNPDINFSGEDELTPRDPSITFSDEDTGLDPLDPTNIDEEKSFIEKAGRFLGDWNLAVAQGATFGTSDEIAAFVGEKLGLGDYDSLLKQIRARHDDIGATTEMLGEIAGGIGATVIGTTMAAPLGATAAGARGAAWLAKLPGWLKAAGLGSIFGAMYGFGQGEGGFEERTEQAKISGAFGAGAGLLYPLGFVAKKGAQFVGSEFNKRWNPMLEAYRRIQEAIKLDGFTASKLRIRLNELGPQATIVDAGGINLQALAKEAAKQPGSAMNRAIQILGSRSHGESERIVRAINRNVNLDDYFAAEEMFLKKFETKAVPLYRKAYEKYQSIMTPKLEKLLRDPDTQKALRETAAILRRERNAGEFKYLGAIDDEITELANYAASVGKMQRPKSPGLTKGFSLEAWDQIKRGFDVLLDNKSFRNEMTGRLNNKGRSVNLLRKRLLEELDNATGGKSGLYSKARKTYGDIAESLDALREGRKALSKEPGQIAKEMNELSDAGKEAYRSGAAASLRDNIFKIKESSTASRAQRIFDSPRQKEQLRALFPMRNERTILEKVLISEMKFNQTMREIMPKRTKVEESSFDLARQTAGSIALLMGSSGQLWLANIRRKFGEALVGPHSDKFREHITKLLINRNPAMNLRAIDLIFQKAGIEELPPAIKYELLNELLPLFAGQQAARVAETKEKKPVYHTGGIVKDYGKIAANLEKMSDINRKRHLTNMFKKNRDEFDRLFDYLGGNS